MTFPLELCGRRPITGWESLVQDEAGFLGAEERLPGLRIWFDSAAARRRVAARLEDALAPAGPDRPPGPGARPFVVPAPEPGRDWTAPYRAFFRGVRAGGFFIHPPEVAPHPALRSLVIAPGAAFGTGMHPTTRMMLAALEERFAHRRATPKRVLDVGTGSGILAVAAALLGAREVIGLDRDPVAVRCAREAASANGVAGRVLIRQGDFRDPDPARGCFELVLANLSGSLLRGLAPFATPRLARRGRVVMSGFLRFEAHEVLRSFSRTPLRVVEIRAEPPAPPETDLWIAAAAELASASRR